MSMFQDTADPIRWLRLGLASSSDEESGDVAGGGGGSETPEENTTLQVEQAEESAAETTQPDGMAEETACVVETDAPLEPEAMEEPVAETPPVIEEELESSEEADRRAFEAALNASMPDERRAKSDYGGAFQALREGDVVLGTVVHIDHEGVLVDVGTKSEGIIRMPELTRDNFQNPEDVVSVGEQISVYVLKTDSEDGSLLLSKKRADFEVAWERVEEASKTGKYITAMVSDRVKGGLVVDLGIRGFVPASHVGSGKVKNLDKFIGQSLPLRVIEVDRERRKVVLSHRMAVEEEREKKREETMTTLEEGQVRTGVVRRITEYGAFVDLGGIDGLLHVSEMSWTRVNHPSEVVKVGQKIQVMVLKMNPDSGRISLGMRQILPDPWHNLGDRFRVGQIINGKISRLVPFGAFVQLEEGVEAIIPNQELSLRRVKRPDQVVSVGQDVEAKILEIRAEERRMTLSVRSIMQEREAVASQPPPQSQPAREAPRTTVADLLGDAFAEQRAEFERDMARETKAKSRARKQARQKDEERAVEEAYGDLSEEELLDLAVTSIDETELEPVSIGHEDVDTAFDAVSEDASTDAKDETASQEEEKPEV